MTKEEKIIKGQKQALKDFEEFQKFKFWQDVTIIKIKPATNGKYSKPVEIKFYNENKEKYKNRPLITYSMGNNNIMNNARIEKLFELFNGVKTCCWW